MVPRGTSGTTKRFGGVSGGDSTRGEGSETVLGVGISSTAPMMMAAIMAGRAIRVIFLLLLIPRFLQYKNILQPIDKGLGMFL